MVGVATGVGAVFEIFTLLGAQLHLRAGWVRPAIVPKNTEFSRARACACAAFSNFRVRVRARARPLQILACACVRVRTHVRAHVRGRQIFFRS